jgi:hypothetical protein
MSKKNTHATAAIEPAPAAPPNPAPNPPAPAVQDLEDAAAAYKRVEPDALALTEDQLSTLNVDVVSATSIILGVVSRVMTYRARMEKLPEFDLRTVDGLGDRAKAAWYAAVTNMPAPEPKDFQNLLDEATTLRQHLLTWADPLVHAKKFDQAAIDQIKEGSGYKDIASDVVALVALYRSKWSEVSAMCGVTDAELERGAVLGPAVFANVSRRENKTLPSLSDGSLKVRRFWTLADRAYDQCQRAIAYFEWGVADLASIAPTLRRSSGTRTSSSSTTTAPTPPAPPNPAPPAPPAPAPAAPVVTSGPQLGGNGGPFAR